MVEQSDITLALIPSDEKGEPFRADGVFMEVAYAHSKGREVLLIWPSHEKPSLMVDHTVQFKSTDEALDYASEKWT
jgi:hypothetical protein